jgi:hypothetical protein
MITAVELNTALWKIGQSKGLGSAITGSVYKDWRPSDSKLEDIVINIITIDGSESIIQSAVCNINIHVPSLETKGGLMPNHARFEELNTYIIPLLKEGFGKNFTFWTEQTALVKEENKSEWYLNYRIRFKQHNNITI